MRAHRRAHERDDVLRPAACPAGASAHDASGLLCRTDRCDCLLPIRTRSSLFPIRSLPNLSTLSAPVIFCTRSGPRGARFEGVLGVGSGWTVRPKNPDASGTAEDIACPSVGVVKPEGQALDAVRPKNPFAAGGSGPPVSLCGLPPWTTAPRTPSNEGKFEKANRQYAAERVGLCICMLLARAWQLPKCNRLDESGHCSRSTKIPNAKWATASSSPAAPTLPASACRWRCEAGCRQRRLRAGICRRRDVGPQKTSSRRHRAAPRALSPRMLR